MSFTDYLFRTPWWLPTAILVVGAVVFYTANNRREMRLRTIGLAIACLGVALAVVSYLVDTDLEKAEKHTKQIVRAVEARDWNTLRSLLDANTSVGIANGLTLYRGADVISDKAKQASEKYGVKSLTITSTDARQDQTLITVTLRLYSTQEYTMEHPVPSTWEFDWQQSAGGWFLSEIRAAEIGRQRAEGMEPMFPKR